MPNATPRGRRARAARLAVFSAAVLGACDGSQGIDNADAGDPAPDAELSGSCPAGGAGLACVMALFDEVAAGCDPGRIEDLRISLERRRGELPVWHEGRALFVTLDQPAAVAGDWNDWSASALVTEAVCGSEIHVADARIESGRYAYQLVAGGDWILDPLNWAFAYDDFAGNPDGANSVLNTYDSGLGHLVRPDVDVCSSELGNCRRFVTYLPAGYGAPDRAGASYPVLFMHDGQNIFDDTDCCFGHTGWEINLQLDTDIAAGLVEPVVVVGFPHAGADRGDEYAYPAQLGGRQETFMEFQTGQVQPAAAELWRLDMDRAYVAGSSFGGLASFRLAFAYPDVYAGAASLSGAFWVGEGEGVAMSDVLDQIGFTAMPLYLDHGGSAAGGGDNYADNVALRDQLANAGWNPSTSPDCTLGAGSLCYHHDDGASHDELAWRDRSFRFLRFFFGI